VRIYRFGQNLANDMQDLGLTVGLDNSNYIFNYLADWDDEVCLEFSN